MQKNKEKRSGLLVFVHRQNPSVLDGYILSYDNRIKAECKEYK